MEFRYLGFDQMQNARAYRFDGLAKGEPARHFVVTADLALFLAHHVGIQEGPSLCALKLAGIPEEGTGQTYELTADDLRAHANARAAAEIRKAEARKSTFKKQAAPATERNQTPWRNSRP